MATRLLNSGSLNRMRTGCFQRASFATYETVLEEGEYIDVPVLQYKMRPLRQNQSASNQHFDEIMGDDKLDTAILGT